MSKKANIVRKLKEAGTKYVQKGNYEKALAQYRKLAKIEPGDLRFAMKVGECLAKLGKKKEAVEQYNEVADNYTKDGLLIKAIAVCKLILQLDPEATDAQDMIAELNARRGIVTTRKRMRPALSLQGVKGPIPSAVKTEEAEEEQPVEPTEPKPAPEEKIEEEAAPEIAEPPAAEEIPEELEEEELEEEEAEPIPLEEAIPEEEEEKEKVEAPPVSDVSELPSFPETPLFSDLSVEEFKRVVAKCQIGTLPKGITVIKEGTKGDSFFIIAGGRVRVYKWSKNHKRKMTLATLEEGSFFGEFAFLTDSARSASIETVEESVLLRINRKDLEEIIKDHPRVQEVMNDFYKKRVLDTLLTISPLFESLGEEDRRSIIARFESVELDTGDVIIKEGEEGKALYIIKHGAIAVSVNHPETDEKIELAVLREGDFFGEISLLQHKPTTATCAATEPTSMFRLPKDSFNEIIMIHPQILETVSATVDQRLKSAAKHLTARKADRQSEGLV